MIKIQENQLLSLPTGKLFSENAVTTVTIPTYDWSEAINSSFSAKSPTINNALNTYTIVERLEVGGVVYYDNRWDIDFSQQYTATINSKDGRFFDVNYNQSSFGYYCELGFYGRNIDKNVNVDFVGFNSFDQSYVTDTNGDTHQIYVTMTKNDMGELVVTTNVLPLKAYVGVGDYNFQPLGLAIKIYNDESRDVIQINNLGTISKGDNKQPMTVDDKYFSSVKLQIVGTNEIYVDYLATRILNSWEDGRRKIEFDCVFDDYADTDGIIVYRRKNAEFFNQGDKFVFDIEYNTARELSLLDDVFEVVESDLHNDNGYVYIHVVAIQYIPFITFTAKGLNHGTYKEIVISSDYEDAVFECETEGITRTVENGGRLISWQLQSIDVTYNIQAHGEFGKTYNYQVIIKTDTSSYKYTDYNGNLHDIKWETVNSGEGSGNEGTIYV